MSSTRLYFDWNAGAPMAQAVRDLMVEVMARPGNPSSVHADGRKARGSVEAARRQVARLVGANPKAVTFTAGGTESANTVLTPDWKLGARAYPLSRLVRSAVEHPCVARGGRFPVDRIDVIPVDANGVIDLDWLERHLASLQEKGERALVSVMLANNETGVIQPVSAAAEITHRYGGLLHSDCVQAVGRIPVDLGNLGADVITLSAHKIGGPQGVGAFVLGSDLLNVSPLITGGGQESGARAGTENVAGIAGFGLAADLALADLGRAGEMAARRDRIEAMITDRLGPGAISGQGVPRLPNTTLCALPGVSAETALIAFDLSGVSLSSGSACSSGKVAASPVLKAMGWPEAVARTALRISIGPSTSDADVARFAELFEKVMAGLMKTTGAKVA